MREMSGKIIGVLGGMGPDATLDLFKKILRNTLAKNDQDHIRIIIDNNPKIPDRTRAILSNGTSPRDALVETARNLERAGVDLLVIPCNTAHYWIEDIRSAVAIQVLDMLDETSNEIASKWPSVKRVGLMASAGTTRSRLYQNRLAHHGIESILPTESEQRSIMDAIYSIKAGNLEVKETLLSICSALIERGAGLIIAGCTEIPLALSGDDISVPFVNPAEILARRAIAAAGGRLTTQV